MTLAKAVSTVWLVDVENDYSDYQAQSLIINALPDVFALLEAKTDRHWQYSLLDITDLSTYLSQGFPEGDIAIVPDKVAERCISIESLQTTPSVMASKQGRLPQLPIGVILWADEARLSASGLLALFHRNAADVLLVAPEHDQGLLTKQLVKAIKRAVRWCHLLQTGERLLTENQQLQKDCQLLRQDQAEGRALQARLMPDDLSRYGNMQIEVYNRPVMALSGDFMEHFAIDDNTVGFYLADISGHGVSAAIVTALLKSFFYRYAAFSRMGKSQTIRNPGKLLSKLSQQMLISQLHKHMAIFYGVYNLNDSTLQYVNAGHFPAPFVMSKGEKASLFPIEKPLGLYPDFRYHNSEIQLPAQFDLIAYSDGWLDCFTCEEKDEKIHQLEQLFQHALSQPGHRQSLTEVMNHMPIDYTQQSDDISLLLCSQF